MIFGNFPSGNPPGEKFRMECISGGSKMKKTFFENSDRSSKYK